MSAPPRDHPPIVLTEDYRAVASDERALPGGALLSGDGRLRLRSTHPGSDHGVPVAPPDLAAPAFRDFIVEAEVELAAGGDDCFYGIFLRQAAPDLYYTFAVSPTGVLWVRLRSGAQTVDVAHGRLAADMRFHAGVGQRNRLAVVASGPCLTFIVNGMVATGTLVDPRCKQGALGYYLHHGAASAGAELGVTWLQVRALLPPSAQAAAD